MWTGAEVIIAGGSAVDESAIGDCDDYGDGEASCAAPEHEHFDDAAAFDPALASWTRLSPRNDGGSVPWSLRATDAGAIGLGASYSRADDAWAALPYLNVLVYDAPHWTGDELIAVGWDYERGERHGVGQVVVAEFDPAIDAEWRVTDWPFEPPGWEAMSSVWTGEEVVAFVWSDLCGADLCSVMLAWNPVTDAWREVPEFHEPYPPRNPSWTGTTIVSGGAQGGLQTIDPATGEIAPLPPAPGGLDAFDPVVRPGAVAVLSGKAGAVLDLETLVWSRLPVLPFDAPASGRTVLWAGDDLLVWGGQFNPSRPDSRNTAEGYLLRLER